MASDPQAMQDMLSQQAAQMQAARAAGPLPNAAANPAIADQLRQQMGSMPQGGMQTLGAAAPARPSLPPMGAIGGSLGPAPAAPAPMPSPAVPALENAAPQAAFNRPAMPPMGMSAPKMGGKAQRAPTAPPRGKSVRGPAPGPSQGRGAAY